MAFKLLKSNIVPLRFNYVYPNGHSWYLSGWKTIPKCAKYICFYFANGITYNTFDRNFCKFEITKINYSKIIGNFYIDESVTSHPADEIIFMLKYLLKKNDYEKHIIFRENNVLDVCLDFQSYHFSGLN